MKVLVCGGRDYADRERVYARLDQLAATTDCLVIGCGYDPNSGKFQGADQLACEWAKARGVPGVAYPAHWRTFGRAAGPLRNRRMLDSFQPALVIAFPGDRGTRNMCAIAEAANVPVERAA